MFCSNCGKDVREGVQFCQHCGSRLNTAASTQAQEPEPKIAPATQYALSPPAKKTWKPIRPWLVMLVGILVFALSFPFVFGQPNYNSPDFAYVYTLVYLLYGLAVALLYQDNSQARVMSHIVFAIATLQILFYVFIANMEIWRFIVAPVVFWGLALNVGRVFRNDYGHISASALLAGGVLILSTAVFGMGSVGYSLLYALCFFAAAVGVSSTIGSFVADRKKSLSLILVACLLIGLALIAITITQNDFVYYRSAFSDNRHLSYYYDFSDNNILRFTLLSFGVIGSFLALFRIRFGLVLTVVSYLYYGFGALFEKFFSSRVENDYTVYANPIRYITAVVVLLLGMSLVIPLLQKKNRQG
jgi:hypothetical protein